jgi:polysaccharide export outer membrane protein
MQATFLRHRWSLIALLVLSACAARAPSSSYVAAAQSDPRRLPYVIGPSDVIRVTVWKDQALSTDAVVRPDGTITLPAIGELRAAGRSAADLQNEARQRVAALVNDPVVTVSVVEVNSYRFTVAGNVENPGLFTSRYYLTVSEAIALAGGPNRYASTGSVVVVRRGERGVQRIGIDYDAILNGRSPDQDIVLLAGDAVQVP